MTSIFWEYMDKMGEISRRYPLKINSVVVISLLSTAFLLATILNVSLSWVFTSKLNYGTQVQNQSQVSLPPFTPTILSDADLETILKRNLFNAEGISGQSKGGENKKNEIQKSELKLTVIGTIYGGDPKSGVAMIENSDTKAINSFMVGDEILPGENAVLSHVLKEKIFILRDNSRYEFLEVANPEFQRSSRKNRGNSSKDSEMAGSSTKSAQDTFSEPGFERKGNSVSMSSEYRRKTLTSDMAKVLQDAKAEPNMVDGKLKGFRLTRIRDDSIYLKAGFQDLDVITEINGIELISASQAISTLQSLRDASKIEITYMRGDQKSTVALNVSN
jgi:general secretion pathway protein C